MGERVVRYEGESGLIHTLRPAVPSVEECERECAALRRANVAQGQESLAVWWEESMPCEACGAAIWDGQQPCMACHARQERERTAGVRG